MEPTASEKPSLAGWVLAVGLTAATLATLVRRLAVAPKNVPQPAKKPTPAPQPARLAPPPPARQPMKAAPAPPPPAPKPEPETEEEQTQDEEQQPEDQDSEVGYPQPGDENDPCDTPEFKEALDVVHNSLQRKYASHCENQEMHAADPVQGIALQFLLPLVLSGLNWLRNYINQPNTDQQ